VNETEVVHPVPRTRTMASFLRSVGRHLIFDAALMALWCWGVGMTMGFGDGVWIWWAASIGLVGTLFGAARQISATRRFGLCGVLDARQSVSLTLTAPVTSVVESYREALRTISATEEHAVGDRHVEIWAKSGGFVIHFSCHPNLDGTLEVHLRSEPIRRWMVFDGGESLTNVKRLAGAFWWREMRQRYAS
jgi:hypothetical protein